MKNLILALAFAGIACTPQQSADAPFVSPLWPQERQQCVRGGGSWERAGILNLPTCFPSYSDAGQACSKASDCQGICLADTRQCSETDYFGCYSYLEENGDAVEICVD